MPTIRSMAIPSLLTGLGFNIASQLLVMLPEMVVKSYEQTKSGLTQLHADIQNYLELAQMADAGTATTADLEALDWFDAYFADPEISASTAALIQQLALVVAGVDFAIRLLSENRYSLLTPFSYASHKIMGFFQRAEVPAVLPHDETHRLLMKLPSP